MSKAGVQSDYYSRSGISIKYDLRDNFPEFWQRYPDEAVEALHQAARKALDFTYPMTPYKPDDARTTMHLRDSAFIQVYKYGSLGGTCFIQWRAKNPHNGYNYGLAQEYGGTKNPPRTYQNYSTPGTESGFMTKTWTFIEQIAPAYVSKATQNLIQEVST